MTDMKSAEKQKDETDDVDKEFKALRFQMVKEQLAWRGIQDETALRAMAEVPRHFFVDPHLAHIAYNDSPLPIQGQQTISQPYIVARMCELLNLDATDRVLDVGTGSGYAAAVMSRIVKGVYSIEQHLVLVHQATDRLAELEYDNVTVSQGDGSLGWPKYAPYDAIMVAAGGPDVPAPLLAQLKINGRLVMPVGNTLRSQTLLRVLRLADNKYEYEDWGGVRFVPLVGEAGWDGKTPPQTDSS
jgi:protein-L-isoaspartate(D-aspartate) O-methyltransferase